MEKTLYMLIGPKGSGKTHIGSLVETHTRICFLRVESIWLSLGPHENGWLKVEREIDERFKGCDKLMIENLGAGEDFHGFLASLEAKYRVEKIRVHADLGECLKRVQNRSSKNHIPVSDSDVEKYNEIASRVILDWSFEIDNNGPATDAELLARFKDL